MHDSAAAGLSSRTTHKRQQKGKEITKKTEKRQLSIDSADSNNQPQEKKPQTNDNGSDDDDGSMITISDDLQNNPSHIGDARARVETYSESESELEIIDFKVATTEAIKAWNDKRERMSRKRAKKIERLLSKNN
ncbi:hypothetical protein RP20_CCG016098 [Aedes albopictus]|nr:hypothetical protein RP20_CCG016098 [Aedes albopictus]